MNAFRSLYSLVLLLLLSSVVHADPRIQYSTYLGGSKSSCTTGQGTPCTVPTPYATSVAIATDASANIYVTGTTNETDFPTTAGAFSRSVNIVCEPDGSACTPITSFLAKFSSSGSLLFSTFLGTNFNVHSMAVDSSGNVYVDGDNNIGGASFREFVTHIEKFTSTGARVYDFTPDTANNCSQQDSPYAIALNPTATAAYVLGFSNSGFGCVPTTPGAYQTKGNGFATGGMWVIKLNLTASSASLAYGTYVGPSDGIFPRCIAVDSSGNAYVTGFVDTQLDPTIVGTFPTTSGAFQTSPGGGAYSGFVTKLNATGTGLIYSTYLRSSGTDQATSIRVDSIGTAYVAGSTDSNTFPHTVTFGAAPNPQMAFITRLNASGSGLVYSALIYGGGGPQFSSTVALGIDSAGNAYVTGRTGSSGFPLSIPFQSSLRGSTDAFFINLSGSGKALLTSSFLGGFGQEQGTGIWVDRSWNSYLTGTTTSTSFPVTSNAYQSTLKGSQAVFVTKKIIDADLSLTASPAPSPVTHGANLTYTYAVTNNGPDSSDGDTLSTSIPAGTTFVSFTTTTGKCSSLAVGATGAFTCTRGSLLLAGHSWGPITLTVKVNTASGGTVSNFAKVATKTQDVNTSNNSASTTVKLQ